MAKINSASPIITTIIMILVSSSSCLANQISVSLLELLQVTDNLVTDPAALKLASVDYGHIVDQKPTAVLKPSSVDEIRSVISSSYNSPTPFTIAAKGQAHSTRGQAQATNGVVVEMSSLKNGTGIVIHPADDAALPSYVDVGGEQLWIDVLNATLKQGLSPVSWTDYLYLTVGGTLSNAGISGQTHRRGPQISNVLELDVVTGKGELVTCSSEKDAELFHAVLGGLGQFGIITRARIRLEPAKQRVKWLRILYSDFASFSLDQETLIAAATTGPAAHSNVTPDFVEGHLLMAQSSLDFYPESQRQQISSLINQHGIVYAIEVAMYYDDDHGEDEKVKKMLRSLKGFVPGFVFQKDATYLEFLNRVHDTEEAALRKKGLWDVPHPWLNLFIPKSGMVEFNNGVFRDILLNQNFTSSFVLVYPLVRNKWDEGMSAVLPEDEEEVFYTVGFLDASVDNWEALDNKNKNVLQFCANAGIEVKQYLGHHETKEEWISHFGSKWDAFQHRKTLFDPKMMLSPGQKIFY